MDDPQAALNPGPGTYK